MPRKARSQKVHHWQNDRLAGTKHCKTGNTNFTRLGVVWEDHAELSAESLWCNSSFSILATERTAAYEQEKVKDIQNWCMYSLWTVLIRSCASCNLLASEKSDSFIHCPKGGKNRETELIRSHLGAGWSTTHVIPYLAIRVYLPYNRVFQPKLTHGRWLPKKHMNSNR